MKILHIAPSLSRLWGGTTTSILGFHYALKALGIDSHIATVSTAKEEKEIALSVINDENIKVFKGKERFWRYAPDLGNYLKTQLQAFDAVHIHGLWTYPTFIASRLARRSKIPYILSPHGMLEEDALSRKGFKKRLYLKLIEQKTFDNASAIHAITDSEAKNSAKITKTPIFTLPNGVNVDDFLPKEYQNINTVAFIGRLHPIKGVDRLIKAVAKSNNIILEIAGKGDEKYEEYIKSLVKDEGVSERVRFLGFLDEHSKRELLARSKFLIVPSHSEVLSLVALESLRYSTPVLITRGCNFNEIERFQAGVIIENNEPNTIAKGIEEILNKDISTLSYNAYNLAKETYELSKIAKRLSEKYKNICQYQ